ncbi:DUF6779 domain-containing protein [Blastococcus deserti]|uniref:DUF6779 domain-containing protein n=1 Tax=Blastococcus deserti TaxID=2259033 RepID=A0ABW4X9A6_9ACTN
MALREDDVAPRSGAADRRTLLQVGGFALAVAATLAVFLTDDPQFLRLAVVAVAWAFVLATVAAATRSGDRMAARAREAEIRRAYEYELDREVAARREYELELETELRREAEASMRAELDALRDELAGLTELRTEVAGLTGLRTDIAALAGLRDEVARVAALRDDVAALPALRQELGQIAELRADLGRLKAELTEQLSSEMLIERIVMRTQAGRLSAELGDAPGRALHAAAGWTDDVPPRELTGGWPAVRLDEPSGTRHFDQVRVERAPARPPVPPAPAPARRPSRESEPSGPRPWETPATASWESRPTPPWEPPAVPAEEPPATASWESRPTPPWEPPSPTSAFPLPAAAAPAGSPSPDVDRWSSQDLRDDDTPLWSATERAGTADRHDGAGAPEPVPPTAGFPMAPPAGGPRPSPHPRTTAGPAQAAPGVPPVTPEPLPSALEWLAARSLIDAGPTPPRPEVPPRRRRGDESPVDPAAAPTTQRPAVPPHPPIRVDDRGGYRVAVREDRPVPPSQEQIAPGQEKRLADILAENGASQTAGGRRRRRYRDEDEPDDVLARVLGGTEAHRPRESRPPSSTSV